MATTPSVPPPARAFDYATLRGLGRTLDELERARKKTEQRIAARHRNGLAAWRYEEEILAALVKAEHYAELDLCRLTRTHPLWVSFAEPILGIGANLFGRLLAQIGNPLVGSRGHWQKDTLVGEDGREIANRVWVIDETYERTVSQLWAYCGFDPNRRKPPSGASQAEVLACGNSAARTAAIKIAMQFKRTVGGNTLPNGVVAGRSPYRDLFDEYKAYQLAAHPELTAGHADNRALRFIAKRFLRELWRAARAGHSAPDSHSTYARASHRDNDIQTRAARAGHKSLDIHSATVRAGQSDNDAQTLRARADRFAGTRS